MQWAVSSGVRWKPKINRAAGFAFQNKLEKQLYCIYCQSTCYEDRMHTPMLCDAWLTFPLMAALMWNDPNITCTPGQLHLLTSLHYAKRAIHISHHGWRRHTGTRALVGILTVSLSTRIPLTRAVVFLWQLRSVKPRTSRYGLSRAFFHHHAHGLLAGFPPFLPGFPSLLKICRCT